MTALPNSNRVGFRKADASDSQFFFKLLNEEGWAKYISKNAAPTLEDAANYIENKVIPSYDDRNIGLWVIYFIANGSPIGVCGLLKRQNLADYDLAIALLDEFHGSGCGFEACTAALRYGFLELAQDTIVAIVTNDNNQCKKLLDGLGFVNSGKYESESGDNLELYRLDAEAFKAEIDH